jgi:SAM-dependent methyltransferase
MRKTRELYELGVLLGLPRNTTVKETYDDEAMRLRRFWDARYNIFSLQESGIKSLSPEYCDLLYRCKWEAYIKAIRSSRINLNKPISILDAGCGQGHMASLIQQEFKNAKYTGIDISRKAINYLRSKMPSFEWICEDFCDTTLNLKDQYHLVQSIEVLHLILNDKNHKIALMNFSSWLRNEGILIITDTLPNRQYFANDYIVFRPLKYYRKLFEECDLELIDLFPMYYWIPDTGLTFWPMRIFFKFIPPHIVYLLDRLLLRLKIPQFKQTHDSKMKIMVLRKF